MDFGIFVGIVFLVWIVYQLGRANEAGEREDKEVEKVIQNVRDDSFFEGSFLKAYNLIVLANAAPSEWSDSFKKKVKKRLVEEARKAGQWP